MNTKDKDSLQRNDNKYYPPCCLEQKLKPKFADISSEWLAARKVQLKASSYSRYVNILKSYLIPSYGDTMIEDISRNDVSSFILNMLSSGGCKHAGLSPKTVNLILSVMKTIFKYAMREKSLSVADIMDIAVKQPQKPLRILNIHEQQQICNYLYSNLSPCNLGILLCIYTGVRIGELCALKWSDIDINNQIVHVHQTMQRIQTNVADVLEPKTKVVILLPKSDCSVRDIPIPSEILELLILNREEGQKFLLTGMEEKYIEPRTLENRFKKIITNCGIQTIKFHGLRHTFATRCIELGFDIKSLSEILGHSSVNITLNRYVHPSMDLKQKNMNKLCGFIISNQNAK